MKLRAIKGLLLLIPFFSNANEFLIIKQGQKSYYSNSELIYTFEKREGTFPKHCTHLPWGLQFWGKPIARGRMRADRALEIKATLPSLKKSILVKGTLTVKLEGKDKTIKTLNYPVALVPKEQFFEGQSVYIYKAEKNSQFIKILEGMGLRVNAVKNITLLEEGPLLAMNLTFNRELELNHELLEYASKGNEVLVLGSTEGKLSLGQDGPKAINLVKKGSLLSH